MRCYAHRFCTLQLYLCNCQRTDRPSKVRTLPVQPSLARSGIAQRTWHRPRYGGADRDRTDDLRLAKPALSQLSYSPLWVVGLGRFELPTSRLSGVRSNHLSYRPAQGLGILTSKTDRHAPGPSKLNSDETGQPKKNPHLPTAGKD